MPKNSNPCILELRRTLRDRGQTISSWSRENGFNEATVLAVVSRHLGKETFPHGELSVQILKRLRELHAS